MNKIISEPLSHTDSVMPFVLRRTIPLTVFEIHLECIGRRINRFFCIHRSMISTNRDEATVGWMNCT